MKLLFSFLLISLIVRGQYLWQINSDGAIKKWNYSDGDEFNLAQVDLEKWIVGFPWSSKIFSQQTYITEKNTVIRDGTINFILAQHDSIIKLHPNEVDSNSFKKNKVPLYDDGRVPFKYSGALLWSKKEYLYGYFEIKFKGVIGQGIWPAFWLYGGKPNYEIDFFELKGEKESSLHVDVHCPSGCSDFKNGILGYRRPWGHWIKLTEKLTEGFNVLAVDWSADNIKWYLNGQLIAEAPLVIKTSMNLSIGIGVAKDDGPFKPGPDKNTPFPNNFIVDYIRMYKTESVPINSEEKLSIPAFENQITAGKTNFRIAKVNSKLKNTGTRKKTEDVITISALPLYSHYLELRVLGIQITDTVQIDLHTVDRKILKSVYLIGNNEIIVETENNREIYLTCKTKVTEFSDKIKL